MMQAIPSEPCPAAPCFCLPMRPLPCSSIYDTAILDCMYLCKQVCMQEARPCTVMVTHTHACSCSSTRNVFSNDASSVAVCGAPTPRAGIMSGMADRRCSHSRPCLLRLQAGVRLTSNSYGGSKHSRIWLEALSKQQEAGIMFVTSAGNGAWAGRVWMRGPAGTTTPLAGRES